MGQMASQAQSAGFCSVTPGTSRPDGHSINCVSHSTNSISSCRHLTDTSFYLIGIILFHLIDILFYFMLLTSSSFLLIDIVFFLRVDIFYHFILSTYFFSRAEDDGWGVARQPFNAGQDEGRVKVGPAGSDSEDLSSDLPPFSEEFPRQSEVAFTPWFLRSCFGISKGATRYNTGVPYL